VKRRGSFDGHSSPGPRDPCSTRSIADKPQVVDRAINPAECDRLWTVADVAEYLSVSRSWVYQHAADGTLPSVRVGGLLRFHPVKIRDLARAK
jgi:excisionase family DNA binding protein